MTISPVPSQDKLVNLQNYEKLLSSLTKPGFRGFRSAREPEHFPRFRRFLQDVGSSKVGRVQKQGEKSDLKVRFLEDLNRKVLQEFPMNVIGTLVFVSFRP